ncbi:Glucose/arabinose dehydrogenase, beta-propeller fold [Klenkia marina]|uniref:Glucose/arabinose dehydrogenase, beta-propeller fold n=1 Tax=Klenkia marina TaxID=1960309 RepID=A0A1G4XZW1_9ACTN|nr:PQQ-dependent sugar dehydrogenase [Klenkia marina]SCX46696.1 Glucose/arabinose dehydrogenase, beta-propeller fold [Klenkia marina]
MTLRRAARPTALIAGLVLLAGCSSGGSGSSDADGAATSAPADAPALDVEVVLDGLDHPWDVAQAPDGTLLLDERGGGFTAVRPDGTAQEVAADLDDLWAEGETGLMGLVLDPAFADSRRFYTCMGVADGGAGGGPGIEVTAWTVDEGWSAATRVADPLVGGIPVNADSGRHGGCRLRFDGAGQLLIGTGDNAVGTNPQDLSTLAGKLLRVDPQTGQPSATNPFLELTDPTSHAVVGYGHRNVQGIAVQPGTGAVFTAEQGSQVDDEVNLATDGGNYGWDPVGDGQYDESVPMTDPDIPGAIAAVWSSGDPTIAVSGITFLDGEQWGAYEGLLLLGVQKDTGVLALRLGPDGELVEQFRVPELEGTYGRVRSPQLGTDGALYLTTDNGDGTDQLLRVTPAS